ncbi:hypothetical protein [Desulfuromonas thiophila]|uniref:hypothetical protein n=1 Tax=Desulfuromonas thiophila TaxID=57664 RepID=UPI0029F5A76F|nr:hypothetical protein [Desulfuromonas thiophila]
MSDEGEAPCCFRLAGILAEIFQKEIPMTRIYLVVAGWYQVGWAIGLKYREGFTRLRGFNLDAAGHACVPGVAWLGAKAGKKGTVSMARIY